MAQAKELGIKCLIFPHRLGERSRQTCEAEALLCSSPASPPHNRRTRNRLGTNGPGTPYSSAGASTRSMTKMAQPNRFKSERKYYVWARGIEGYRSIVGRLFAFHEVDLDSISDITSDPQSNARSET